MFTDYSRSSARATSLTIKAYAIWLAFTGLIGGVGRHQITGLYG